MNARDQLAALMVHYFRTAFEAAGISFDGDHRSEVEEMANLIVTIARSEAVDAIDDLTPTQGV